MRALTLCLVPAFALAACSDGGADADGDGTITAEEAVAEAGSGGDLAMRPGQWEQTIEFTDMEMPGMPEGMRDMMARQFDTAITHTQCLTEEDVAQPDADYFAGNQDNCTFNEFDRSGNSMTMDMTCDSGDGGTANMKMEGEFSAESYTMQIQSTVSGMPTGDMRMNGTVTGRRIGDC